MADQLVVRCTQCGTVHSARNVDGGFVLSTEGDGCPCGSRSFVEFPPGARPVEE